MTEPGMPPPPPIDLPRPPRSGLRTGCVVAIVLAALAGIVLVAGGVWLMGFGLDVFAEQVKQDIQDNPVVLEHIGRIETIEANLSATAAEPNEDIFVYEIEGTKSNAVLTAVTITVDANTEKVTWGQLRMPSGEVLDLFPDQGPKPR